MKRKSFRAAVLFNLNKPLKIIEIEFPKEISKGQILIRLKSSSITELNLTRLVELKVQISIYHI